MIRSRTKFAALFLLASTISAVAQKAPEKGFRDLFNRKDLSGWTNVNCAPETWSVKDGMIHCTGKPTGALRTDRQYENFILELEWRHLKPGGNAGIFIWSSPVSAKGQPFLRAIEVQVLDHAYGKSDWFTTHGDVFPIHGSRMKPHGRHNGQRSFPSEERSKGSPEWNHYRIECKDGVLRLHVNGKEVSGGSECNWRKGYIALESEGSPIDFRNIRIKELPTGKNKATKEQSAPEARGFKTLYTGTDLRGWKAEGEGWRSSGWRLTRGKAADPAILWSERGFRKAELIADWHNPNKKGAEQKPVHLILGVVGEKVEPLPIFRSEDHQGKGWHRIHAVVGKDTVEVSVNGGKPKVVKIPEAIWSIAPDKDWKLGLFAVGTAEFAGLYVLDTKEEE